MSEACRRRSLSVLLHTVLQRLKACTSLAPARRRVSAHALIVAPVVNTSSIRRTLPRRRPLALKAPATFALLPAAVSST